MECKNPFIENFCRALIKRKGEKLPDDAMEKLVDDLYRLFENMLGRNMVTALPEDLRAQYVAKYDKGSRDPDFGEIAQFFEKHVDNPEEIMKKTMNEFTAIYFKNR